jgi:hypothetical protein
LRLRRPAIPFLALLTVLAVIPDSARAAEPAEIDCDVCVVVGGSGGYGAALAAARAGARVVLVERQARLGGTSTSSFVANWEPGPGCPLARELYDRLASQDGAAAIAARLHRYRAKEPYGIAYGTPDARLRYEDTLRRAGVPHDRQCSVVMQPEALAGAMQALLKDAGVRIHLQTAFEKAEGDDGTVRDIRVSGPQGRLRVRARVYVDATGGAHLCRALGCETLLGVDARDRFGEPSAPEKPAAFLNAISLCYRIRRAAQPKRQPAPAAKVPFPRTAFVSGVSADELIVNPLPLVDGMMLIRKGYAETLSAARLRMTAHWHWLQGHPHFRNYELRDVAPMLGIRESHRVVTEHILVEQDVRAGGGWRQQADTVAIADHALDIHGGGHGAKEIAAPYGIPYRCLIPKGWTNLLVACRGAGFSHIAASSCRLSRTVMALGHAAGLAAAEAAREGKDVRRIDVSPFRRRLGAPKETE